MTTAAQVQASYAAANRGQTLDTASATAIAAQIDGSGGTFTLNTYVSQQFEANQNTTGLALQVFQGITGKAEANAADLTTVTNTMKTLIAAYPTLAANSVPQAIADDIGAQLADNATGATFRAANNLAGLYNNATANPANFDVNGFVTNWLTNVFGAAAVTGLAVNFEAARFVELANRFKGFTDANDTTGYVRAAGAIVAELINQGEQANNGLYHGPALAFITADASGNAAYGQNILAAGGGTGGGGTTTGVGGNIFGLTAFTGVSVGGADIVPTGPLPNTNDDYLNGTLTNSLTPNDNLNGGNGLDIMFAKLDPTVIPGAGGGTTPLQVNVQNVEIHDYQNISGTLQTVDLSLSTGIQQLWDQNSAAAGGLTFNNVAASAPSNGVVVPTIGIANGGTIHTDTVNLFNSGGTVSNATVNVQLDHASNGTVGAQVIGFLTSVGLTINGVKSEVVTLAQHTGNALIANPDNTEVGTGPYVAINDVTFESTAASLSSIAVKGAGELVFLQGANLTNSLTSLDASGMTVATGTAASTITGLGAGAGFTSNGLVADLSADTKVLTALGGAGNDYFKASATVAQTLQGNKGGDYYELGGVITDKTVVKIAAASDSILGANDVVNKFFSGGSDKIDVAALGFTGTNAITGTNLVTTALTPGGDVAGMFTAGGSQALFNSVSGTLYLDSNHDGSFNAATDTVIVFTANVGAPKVADFIFA